MWQRSWSWRASLAWALLGPSLVLLVQVESALVVIDALRATRLPGELRHWPALVAGAVVVMVTAAQLSTALWRRLGAAQRELSERRRAQERELADIVHRARTSEADDSEHAASPALPEGHLPVSLNLFLLPTRRLQRLAWTLSEEEPMFGDARRIVERFGLEPSWAFQQLDENLEAPTARRLTRGAQMADARWAGHATAFVFALAAFSLLFVLAISYAIDLTPAVVLTVWLGVLMLGQLVAAAVAGRAVVLNERQFYPRVEALLELHRFDLYRALAVPSPRDSSQEQEGWISAWRLGSGRIAFEQGEAWDESDVRQQVAGLTELLRGPELVPYEGYVSWEAGDDEVQLAFGRTPILDGGHARLQVVGSDNASHAPFEITADSAGVALVQVRASVQAPVNGGTARVTFDFQRRSDAGKDAPELWFEISQRGRFIQLLRVKAPRPSSQWKAR